MYLICLLTLVLFLDFGFELVSHRFSIKGRVYPAILPVENKKVTGKVFIMILFILMAALHSFALSNCTTAMSVRLKSIHELVHICLNNSFREFRLHYTLCV